MEKIINYKLKDFFKLQDDVLISDYIAVLNLLNPLKEISNPKYRFYKREPKAIKIKSINELTYGEVTLIRKHLNTGSIESIIQVVKMVTGLEDKHIFNFTITTFYGIISFITSEIQRIVNIENNELNDDSFDVNVEAVNAKYRMSRFGAINVIDSLAKEDILKWEQIEKLPYMTVLTKLMMDNEKNKIRNEITDLQKRKQQ